MESTATTDRGEVARAGELHLDRLPVEFRPDPALMKYYAIASLAAGPFFFFPLLPLVFRYRTLRYRIDDEGISVRWGVLFRREVSLNYGRIQDIHLSSNVVERWLGLGKLQVQTASGSAKAEMTIEGVPGIERMRDFLYGRMRGVKDDDVAVAPTAADVPASAGSDELARTLRAIAAEVRALRHALEAAPDDATRGTPDA